jgi:hypothetical protein
MSRCAAEAVFITEILRTALTTANIYHHILKVDAICPGERRRMARLDLTATKQLTQLRAAVRPSSAIALIVARLAF